ncbi:MAG TPA: PKD domain-containing protein [Gemmatimonadales bacterium]|nr:PKD domain-containing protein [Gemmatimonadales bacterium]
MRSSRALTLVAGVAVLAACGDSNDPSNAAPTAAFDAPSCTLLACNFVGGGTDGDGSIASYAWNFGDPTSGSNTAATKDASHTFSGAGTYTVTLTVTDNEGAVDDVTRDVTVATTPGNQAPVADFTSLCSALHCDFDAAGSSDADGSVVGWSWDFGDGSPAATTETASHDYGATSATTYTVTLTVTDNQGATNTKTTDINVAPAAGLTCQNGLACTLDLPQNSSVVVTLVSSDCEIHNNALVFTSPIQATIFTDGCYTTPGTTVTLDNNGSQIFNSGTQLAAEVRSGFSGTTQPQLRVSGDYATGWTLEYDDGFVGVGEPDFNDLVITVVATPE